MASTNFEVEAQTPFHQSLIWQLNRDFYQEEGMEAWRSGNVPHQLTSNSMVGKTYAELIFAMLRDLSYQGQTTEKVYLLELGAGHGRLAFHILKHLERLTAQENLNLPPYCYVLSDIATKNLDFFNKHPQFQTYFEAGILDVAYFDGVNSKSLQLQKTSLTINTGELNQPILLIANYFFDSIPNHLFHLQDDKISSCSISLGTKNDPQHMDTAELLKTMDISFHDLPLMKPPYKKAIYNEILEHYRPLIFDTYLFFPHTGMQCIDSVRQLSKKGLMLISMDKGFHEIRDLENVKKPEMVAHGSISFWVNYHALAAYCNKTGGYSMLPIASTFHLELACLLFLPAAETFTETKAAYQRVVNDFGPDDFNGFKKFFYNNISKMGVEDLIGFLRLSHYDATLFMRILPQLKQAIQQVSFNQRKRLAETLHHIWEMYFTFNEKKDLAFAIGGIFYSLGFYKDALIHFQHSIKLYGDTPDVFFNRALCHYHLREDEHFVALVKEAKAAFPDFEKFAYLDTLDLNAE